MVGEGRPEIGLLVFPAPGRRSDDAGTDTGGALRDEAYARELRAALAGLAAKATGSSMRIALALVLAEPASIGAGEITPKGSLNVRTVTARRASLVERLYDDEDPAAIRLPDPERTLSERP